MAVPTIKSSCALLDMTVSTPTVSGIWCHSRTVLAAEGASTR
jgi:hypothetical protein